MGQPLTAKRLAARAVGQFAGLSGATALLRRRRRRAKDFRVFILEYHGVDPDDREWEGTIAQSRFDRHVAWLKRHYTLTTVADAARALASGRLGEDLAVLTFDDGYANNVEGAWPVLRAHGVPATLYLTTGFLDGDELWFDVSRRALAALSRAGRDLDAPADLVAALGGQPGRVPLEVAMRRLKALPAIERRRAVEGLRHLCEGAGLDLGEPARPMTWDQARQLAAADVELGAHTVSHPILSRTDPDDQEREIVGSARRLGEELGAPPATFAMPNGGAADYDRHTLEILARHGFLAACTTRRGSNVPGGDPYQLRRLGVGSDTVAMLSARLAGLFGEGLRRLLPF